MTHFPIIDSVARAYRFVWQSRMIWAQYALITIFIKGGCAAAVILLDMSEHPLRAGLLSLPATFAEGLLVAFIIQLAIMQMPKQGNLLIVISKLNLKIAMTVYVLIQLCLSLLSGFILTAQDHPLVESLTNPSDQGGTSLPFFALVIIALMAGIWAYRLLLFYIPYALGVGGRRYLRTFSTFSASLPMMGVTFLVMLPMAVVMIIILQALVPTHVNDTAELSQSQTILFVLIQIPFSVLMIILNGVAMAYGMAPALLGKDID